MTSIPMSYLYLYLVLARRFIANHLAVGEARLYSEQYTKATMPGVKESVRMAIDLAGGLLLYCLVA